jgi:hypothetical protein
VTSQEGLVKRSFPRWASAPSWPSFTTTSGTIAARLLDGGFGIIGPGDSGGLAGVGQQQVDILQQLFQAAAPYVLRIVIGIERDGETGGFQAAE